MKIARYGLISLVLTLVIWQSSLAGDKKPDWVKEHPVSKIYYIGIASVTKTPDNTEYIQQAKDAALSNLAAQIEVKISGELVSILVEKGGMVEEDVKRQIRSETQAELEDYELVDTWEDKNTFWAYYRLSKEQYAARKREKLNRAISLSLDLYTKAKDHERKNDPEKALQFYFQAINPIEKYISEPLETEFEGNRILLFNEIYYSIQDILSGIQLTPKTAELEGKIGQGLAEPLQVKTSYKLAAAPNLPLIFRFTRGDGDLVSHTRANSQGLAKARLSKIKALDRIQMITADLDLKEPANYDNSSAIIQGIVKSASVPQTRFVINVTGLTAYIESHETHFGKALQVLAVEPALKNAMSARGFTFVDNKISADVMITVQAESREGVEIIGGMYSSFVDMTLSALDMKTGDEIFKKTYHKVKGIDLDFNKAGLKAFKNAGETAADEALPDILEALQR